MALTFDNFDEENLFDFLKGSADTSDNFNPDDLFADPVFTDFLSESSAPVTNFDIHSVSSPGLSIPELSPLRSLSASSSPPHAQDFDMSNSTAPYQSPTAQSEDLSSVLRNLSSIVSVDEATGQVSLRGVPVDSSADQPQLVSQLRPLVNGDSELVGVLKQMNSNLSSLLALQGKKDDGSSPSAWPAPSGATATATAFPESAYSAPAPIPTAASTNARSKGKRQRTDDSAHVSSAVSAALANGDSSGSEHGSFALTAEEEKELKKQKRMIKNRESAAASRERKRVYTETLEVQVKDLKTENSALTQRVASLTSENALLRANVSTLQQQVLKYQGGSTGTPATNARGPPAMTQPSQAAAAALASLAIPTPLSVAALTNQLGANIGFNPAVAAAMAQRAPPSMSAPSFNPFAMMMMRGFGGGGSNGSTALSAAPRTAAKAGMLLVVLFSFAVFLSVTDLTGEVGGNGSSLDHQMPSAGTVEDYSREVIPQAYGSEHSRRFGKRAILGIYDSTPAEDTKPNASYTETTRVKIEEPSSPGSASSASAGGEWTTVHVKSPLFFQGAPQASFRGGKKSPQARHDPYRVKYEQRSQSPGALSAEDLDDPTPIDILAQVPENYLPYRDGLNGGDMMEDHQIGYKYEKGQEGMALQSVSSNGAQQDCQGYAGVLSVPSTEYSDNTIYFYCPQAVPLIPNTSPSVGNAQGDPQISILIPQDSLNFLGGDGYEQYQQQQGVASDPSALLHFNYDYNSGEIGKAFFTPTAEEQDSVVVNATAQTL